MDVLDLIAIALLLLPSNVGVEARVVAAALGNGIDPAVLRAVLIVESGMRSDARGRFGVGIAQMTPAGVRGVNQARVRSGRRADFSMIKAMDPAEAIPAAAELLVAFRRACGGIAPGLAGFNAGWSDCRAVRRWGALGAARRGFRGGRYALKVMRLAGRR